jgi:hypothetical protein
MGRSDVLYCFNSEQLRFLAAEAMGHGRHVHRTFSGHTVLIGLAFVFCRQSKVFKRVRGLGFVSGLQSIHARTSRHHSQISPEALMFWINRDTLRRVLTDDTFGAYRASASNQSSLLTLLTPAVTNMVDSLAPRVCLRCRRPVVDRGRPVHVKITWGGQAGRNSAT